MKELTASKPETNARGMLVGTEIKKLTERDRDRGKTGRYVGDGAMGSGTRRESEVLCHVCLMLFAQRL